MSDTRPYFETATVLSVPLFSGGGTRFKILEAFRHGLPVVSSEKGCEGLDVLHERHLLIARNRAEHVQYLIQLIDDTERCAALAGHARTLLREKYTISTAVKQWGDCVERIRADAESNTTRG